MPVWARLVHDPPPGGSEQQPRPAGGKCGMMSGNRMNPVRIEKRGRGGTIGDREAPACRMEPPGMMLVISIDEPPVDTLAKVGKFQTETLPTTGAPKQIYSPCFPAP
jgi:hypothetical protein